MTVQIRKTKKETKSDRRDSPPEHGCSTANPPAHARRYNYLFKEDRTQ